MGDATAVCRFVTRSSRFLQDVAKSEAVISAPKPDAEGRTQAQRRRDPRSAGAGGAASAATAVTASASRSHSASNTVAVTDIPSTATKRPLESWIGAATQQKFSSNSSRSKAYPSSRTLASSSESRCAVVIVCGVKVRSPRAT